MFDSNKKGYLPFLIPGLILFLTIIAIPFAMNVYISFTKWTGVGIPHFIGFKNYFKIFVDAVFWASFRNNIAMIFSVTVVPTILGLIFSFILFYSIKKVFGTATVNLIRSGIYLPQIMPVAIAGVVWGWILNPGFGVLNWILEALNLEFLIHNWLGDAKTALPTIMFIMVWFQVGYPLIIFMSALQRIDPQIIEAASIDGASWFEKFKITTYMIQPEIMVVVLTTTIYALKLFAQIYVLTRGGPGNATLVPSYFAYQNFFEKARVGYGATISTIMTIIILILVAFFIRTQLKFEKREEA
jgi:raffinose/stachyose/melibiose transport system permease protein